MPESFNGMPLHPLVVHAAVVLVPLAFVGLILIVARRSWRRTLGWWVVLLAFFAMGATVLAKESGERLAEVVGTPTHHASLGDGLPIFVGLMFLFIFLYVAAAWFTDRRDARDGGVPATATGSAANTAAFDVDDTERRRGSTLVRVLGVVAILVGIATMFQTFRVGDTGAQAVWAGRLTAANTTGGAGASVSPAPGSPSAAPSASPGGSASGSAAGSASDAASPSASGSASASASKSGSTASLRTITMSEVRKHDVASDCWAVVNGKVYDLSTWVSEHPGGSGPIISLCGTDGTKAFENQHDSAPQPNNELATLQIGVLS